MDTALRNACANDLKNRCQHSLAEIDKDSNVRESALNCLQTYHEELESEQCKSEVSMPLGTCLGGWTFVLYWVRAVQFCCGLIRCSVALTLY